MEEPIDLAPLDPDADADREDRVVGAAMRRIAARSGQGGSPSRLASAAGLVAALAIGVALGWAWRGAVAPETPAPISIAGDAGALEASPVALGSVFDEIGIREDQRANIRAVIEVRDPGSDRLFVAVAEELHRLLEERNERIRGMLDPDQLSAYDRRLASSSVVGFRREYLLDNARVRLEAFLDAAR